MTDKSLEELANIKFPVPLSRFKSVHLLQFVQRSGNYRIHLSGEFTGRLENGKRSIYTTKMSGEIISLNKSLVTTSFELKRNDERYREFDALRLSSIGRDYDEIELDEAKLWRDINKYVSMAFNQKLKS